MSGDYFDLVFSGQLVKGFELAQAQKNVQALFKIDDTRARALFSGKEVILKKGLDFDTASKYRVAMKKAGIVVNLVEASAAAQASSASKQAATNSVSSSSSAPEQNMAPTKPSTTEGFSTDLGAQASKPQEPRRPIEAPDFGVADQQGYLVNESELDRPAAIHVDIGDIDLRPQEGFLVDESERQRTPDSNVAIPNFDVAPAGSEVLKAEERKVVQPVAVDVGDLSVAEAGTRLSPEKKAAPPAPSVDHIKLAD